MKTSITRVTILAGLAFSTTALNAAVVNVNILRTGTAGTVTNPGYGLWSQGTEVWNVTAATSATDLVDSTGAATTIGYSLTSFSGSNLNTSWGVDDLTQQGKFGPTDDTTVHNATISGLTVGAKYDLIFYFAGNNRNEIQTANGVAPSEKSGW